jgi:Mn-dependent DtxR family transcriptional regulator
MSAIRIEDWLEALRAATTRNDGGSTTEELCEALGLSDRTVLKRIRQAHKRGWVTVGKRSRVRLDGKPDYVPTYIITVPVKGGKK